MKGNWKEEIIAEIRLELDALEKAGEEPKDVAELERLTIKMSQKVGARTWEKWMAARAKSSSFSP